MICFRFTLAVLAAVLLWSIPRPAPATVSEQRARLPPPAKCNDPVTGIWKSHKYDPRFRDWYIFTLNIRRSEKDSETLEGTIRAHSWTGRRTEEEPPPCRPGLRHWAVIMQARGTISKTGQIGFGGTSWKLEHAYCGPPVRRGQYNLDHFSGVIDPKLQEFQSVNNDGGRSVNDPTVFRRVGCHRESPASHADPTPPPVTPSKGCGFGSIL